MDFTSLTDGYLSVRPWRVDQADELAALYGESDIRAQLPAEDHWLLDQEGAFETLAAAAVTDTELQFCVQVGETVGMATLGRALAADPWEISIAVASAHRGRGYAVRAVRLLCVWAANELDAGRIVAVVRSDNAASRRVFESAGFVECDDPAPEPAFNVMQWGTPAR